MGKWGQGFEVEKIVTTLVKEIEKLSLEKGISKSHLCTTSFQALEFCKKLGYTG